MKEPRFPRREKRNVTRVGGDPNELYCTTCNTWYDRRDKGEYRKHRHIERKGK